MVKRSLLILTVVIVCAVGCATDNIKSGPNCAALIEHLQQENIPALESVEIWPNKYGPGLKVVTAHYEIFTTFLEPGTLRCCPGFMESVYRAYNSQLPSPSRHKPSLLFTSSATVNSGSVSRGTSPASRRKHSAKSRPVRTTTTAPA